MVELCKEEVYGEEFVVLRIAEEEGDRRTSGGSGEDELDILCCLAGECK